MKKQTKIIIAVVLVVAVVILIISFIYPPIFKGLTTGTFGKAEKYHKQQMTEKDVQLRSEFVQDTAQLRGMIQGLIYFSLFSQDLSFTIDTCVRTFESHGMCTKQSEDCNKMSILKDYSVFIKNNTKTLNSTIRMLTDFYLKDTTDQSIDVEKNLRDFGNYVSQLNERDSIVESVLKSMDRYVLGPSMKETKKSELAGLKSIRDRLLVKGIQLAGLLQDKPLCVILLNYALSSQSQFSAIASKPQLGVLYNQSLQNALSAQSLGLFLSSHPLGIIPDTQLGELISAQQVQSAVKSIELGNAVGSVMVYDKPTLCFFLCNQSDLQGYLSSQQMNAVTLGNQWLGRIEPVASFSSLGVNLMQSNFDLKSIYQSQQLGSVLSSTQMNALLGQEGLGVVYGMSFIGLVGELGSQGFLGFGSPEPL